MPVAPAAFPQTRKLALRSRADWRPSWPLLTGAGVFLLGVADGRGMLLDGDTFTHIAAGRWIVEHAAVPTRDPFSHSMLGAPWTAHEWLAEVLLAVAHDAGGLGAVVALGAAAFAVTIALLTRVLLRWLEPIYVLLFVMLAVVMSASHLLARPHILAMPLLLLWTSELVCARSERRSPRLWLLPVMTAWANLHGGFTLGLALAGVLALEAVVDAARAERSATAWMWGRFLLLAFACALLTPHGVDGILFTWHMMTNLSYTLDRVGEWRSPDFHRPQPLELWLLGMLAFALSRGVRFPPVRVALVLLLVHLSLKHIRHVELLGLLAPLLLAPALAAHRSATEGERRDLEAADRAMRALAAPAGRAAFAAVLALLVAAALLANRLRPLEAPGPTEAVRAARAAGLTGPVLNSYGWGGYLTYVGIPPFIDGRADMYGDAFVREYVETTAPASAEGMHKALDKHRIAWTLLDASSPAIALLDLSPAWRRVYTDAGAVIHARRQPLPPATVRRAGP